ncbi:hypothetical protein ACFW4M_20890 [Streptomyces sp. NPDC058794]|uniref:hypothetical protein n=1 Tax=Streptomyces sp. NPDC058794 TaxID=3346636 RepID=UPI0036B1147D
MLTGKTKHSVRNAKIRYIDDPKICPVRAWTAYRTRLVTEHGPQWADPSTPAFVGIDGHPGLPSSSTRARRPARSSSSMHLLGWEDPARSDDQRRHAVSRQRSSASP